MKRKIKEIIRWVVVHLVVFLILGVLVYLYRIHITALMLYWILKDMII